MADDKHDRTISVGKNAMPRGGPRVLVVTEDAVATHYLPRTGEVSVGRFTGSKVVIDHGTLSRMHAIVRLTSEDMTIEDLGSENGTYVRELRVKPGQPTSFSAGDVVRVGDVFLIFRL
jgi:pSer/pThr/pTyr-binding forkhead associated (FHA) protein